jgi:hypothetical protein
LIRVLPLDLGLAGTLARASPNLGSAMCPCFHKPPALSCLSLAFKLPSGIPDTWSVPSYILLVTFTHWSAGTTSPLWWYAKLLAAKPQVCWKYQPPPPSWWCARTTGSQRGDHYRWQKQFSYIWLVPASSYLLSNLGLVDTISSLR